MSARPAPVPGPVPAPAPAQHASPIARAALLAYTLLIVYASLFPFSGWRSNGLSPFAYAMHWELPRYWTGFDVGVNVVGYVPLGVLIVFALYPRVRGLAAPLLACLCGAALSGAMEATQSYLPSRVSSNLDLYTNAAGCCIGAALGALTARRVLGRAQLQRLRHSWFVQNASQGLVLLALWPLAQVYPQAYLFGLGQLLPILSGWLSALAGRGIDLAGCLRPAAALTAEQYWLSETIIAACGMSGAGLMLLCLLRRAAPKGLLIMVLIGAALVVRALASALLFAPENAFVWITPGAEGGVLIGAIMLSGLLFAPQASQRRLAALTLLLSALIANSTPPNPYFQATLQSWVQGKFLNFNGAAQFLALLWPVCALWYLSLASHKLNRP